MNSNDLHSLLESLFSFRFRVDLCMHPDNLDRFANRLEVIELRNMDLIVHVFRVSARIDSIDLSSERPYSYTIHSVFRPLFFNVTV